ncbi:hypothetical protein MKW92_045081 [Papaver armeniacum]|nr:hypothetical protein MKW92_045081 [Papaver armeniacum]
MGSDAGSRKRSRIDASVESNQGSSSGPRKIPTLIDHAQRRELIQPENKKCQIKKRRKRTCLGLGRSQGSFNKAKHQELESFEDNKKRQENERGVYQRIRQENEKKNGMASASRVRVILVTIEIVHFYLFSLKKKLYK